MALNREELVYMAEVAEQTERFDQMIVYVKDILKINSDLTSRERNFFSVAYKNLVSSKRTSWRVLSSIEKKEEEKGSEKRHLLKDFKAALKKELEQICTEVIDILDNKLLKNEKNNDESLIFYLKMKGDYHRYVTEFTTGALRKEAVDSANEAYKRAIDIARDSLSTVNPTRLGLALNYSVFYYECMGNPNMACQVAKNAFDDAIKEIETLDSPDYRDSTIIMQLIRDNLSLWTAEMEEDEKKS